MATRNIIESDISGKTNASTVAFAIGDDWYEVDLTADEEKALEKALKTYVEAGRKVAPKGEPKPKQVPYTSVEEREVMRKWANENGYDLKGFGRIPKDVREAYDAAHGIKRKKQ